MVTGSVSTAADRNKQPILEVLREVLPAQGTALEIASGTGQHATWFAAALPGWTWQPTDADASALPSIAAWTAQSGLSNVRPPLLLDVMMQQWPAQGPPFTEPFDAIYCANMLHIAPWAACAALMQGTARHLAPGGVLITYGPYLEDGVPTAPGNLSFDQSLRARNPAWGIRHIQDVKREAQRCGLALRERHALPANNLVLVFARQAGNILRP
jgi:SAM-dependent methyltransferase